MRADSYPEALALVNDNPYGNGTAIFTCDGGAARLFEQEATAEAKGAFELSTGLSREERLLVEGRYRATMKSWDEAAAIYRGLFGFFPDNLEYGLMLVEAARLGGKGKDALATVEASSCSPTAM